MVEQRPFKALVLGSSPSQPTFVMPWVYILRGKSGRHYIGSTDDLSRRLAEHQRGSNHTTRRLGGEVKLVASKQLSTMAKARRLELQLKRKKNPQVAMFILQSSSST
jgi:putative endonuclease